MKPVHRHLVSMQCRLNVDLELAHSILDQLPLDKDKLAGQYKLLHDMSCGRFHFKLSRFGRFFTSMCYQKRETRRVLSADGGRLAGADMRCAQPALLGWLLSGRVPVPLFEEFSRWIPQTAVALLRAGAGMSSLELDCSSSPRRFPNSFLFTTYPPVSTCFTLTSNDSSLIKDTVRQVRRRGQGERRAALHKMLQHCGGDGSDEVNRYLNAVRQDLYGHLQECALKMGVTLTRDEIKRRLLVDVLAKKRNANGSSYPSDTEKVFRQEFPGVWELIRLVNGSGYRNYNLPRVLQRLESWLVVETIAAKLLEQHPCMFIGTVHDAIYTTEQHESEMRSVFNETLTTLGVPTTAERVDTGDTVSDDFEFSQLGCDKDDDVPLIYPDGSCAEGIL